MVYFYEFNFKIRNKNNKKESIWVIANDFSKRKRKSLIIRIFLEMLLTDWRGKKKRKEWRNKKRKYNSLRLDVVWVFVLVYVVEIVIGYNLIMYKTQS